MLTQKMLDDALEAMMNEPYRPKQYVCHPTEKAHLESHGGDGLGDRTGKCDTCLSIWLRMEARAL